MYGYVWEYFATCIVVIFIYVRIRIPCYQEVLRICAAMDEMMDESKEEGSTPGRAAAGGGGGGKASAIAAK